MARTCKMCGQPIRGASYEIAASAVVGNYATTWKVCRSCFDLVAAEESDDEDDDIFAPRSPQR